MIKIGVSLLTALLEESRIRAATRAAMDTLWASDVRAGREVHFVCLDNGSVGTEADRALAHIGRYGAVTRTPTNTGIARGRNVVLARLLEVCPDLDYVVEIHNDHIFPSGWAEPLLAYMAAHPDAGAAGPGLLTVRGDFGSPAIRPDSSWSPAFCQTVEEVARAARERYRDAIPQVRRGLSHPVVKRISALRRVGLFYDERYAGQNFEDTDEVRRLEAAGYTVGIHLGSWVYHHYNLSRLRLEDPYLAYQRNLAKFRQRCPDADEWLRRWERDLQRVYAHRGAGRRLFRPLLHPAERHPASLMLSSLATAIGWKVQALARAVRHTSGSTAAHLDRT
jgi:GT2 family glycosyltransferase